MTQLSLHRHRWWQRVRPYSTE